MSDHIRDRISRLEAKQEAYHEAQIASNNAQNDRLDTIIDLLGCVSAHGEAIKNLKRYVSGLTTAFVAAFGYYLKGQ